MANTLDEFMDRQSAPLSGPDGELTITGIKNMERISGLKRGENPDDILVPFRDLVTGETRGIQMIKDAGFSEQWQLAEEGEKLSGCAHFAGSDAPDDQQPVIITSGLPDASVLLEQYPDSFILNAGSDSNLADVAEQAREQWPDNGIVIAGSHNIKIEMNVDDPDNPELSDTADLKQAAAELADKVQGVAIYPDKKFTSFMHAAQEQNPLVFEKKLEKAMQDAEKKLGLNVDKKLGIGL